MTIYLGADHRGFELKEKLGNYLKSGGYEAVDLGNDHYDETDDYPDFAYKAALEVGKDPLSRGILICGSGMGMDVAANKIKGVRATVAYSKEAARHARTNDDINVITLSGDSLEFEEAKEIVDIFLKTEFSGEERHVRRLKKIEEIEEKHLKE